MSVNTDGINKEPLTHDILTEMFEEDAQAGSSGQKMGLSLDKAQTDILYTSWRCQAPDKLSAYKYAYIESYWFSIASV